MDEKNTPEETGEARHTLYFGAIPKEAEPDILELLAKLKPHGIQKIAVFAHYQPEGTPRGKVQIGGDPEMHIYADSMLGVGGRETILSALARDLLCQSGVLIGEGKEGETMAAHLIREAGTLKAFFEGKKDAKHVKFCRMIEQVLALLEEGQSIPPIYGVFAAMFGVMLDDFKAAAGVPGFEKPDPVRELFFGGGPVHEEVPLANRIIAIITRNLADFETLELDMAGFVFHVTDNENGGGEIINVIKDRTAKMGDIHGVAATPQTIAGLITRINDPEQTGFVDGPSDVMLLIDSGLDPRQPVRDIHAEQQAGQAPDMVATDTVATPGPETPEPERNEE